MKKDFLIINILTISWISLTQAQAIDTAQDDPFCSMVERIYNTDVMMFNSLHKVKKVFETDTTTSSASVIVQKKGTTIKFLLITPQAGEEELLFHQDTCWVVDHQAESLTFIGTTIDPIEQSDLAYFAPLDIYAIDTLVKQTEPFWQVIEKNESVTKINVSIKNQPKEVSGLKVEFTIGNNNHLIYNILKEFMYMNADKMFEETVFSGYAFPLADQVKIPEYFTIYSKDLSIFSQRMPNTVRTEENIREEVYLTNIEVHDLQGNRHQLPAEGLIFLDFWYVGCAPCMQSAPIIEKVYENYKNQVYFFSVNEVDRDISKIHRFCDKMGISMPVLMGGPTKIAGKIPNAGGYPVFILLEAETGKVLWSLHGYSENLEEMVKDVIERNL